MNRVRLYHLASDWSVSPIAMMEALHEAGKRDLRSHYAEVDEERVPEVHQVLLDAGLFPEPEDEAGEAAEAPADEVAPEQPEAVEVEAPVETPAVEEQAPAEEPAPAVEEQAPEQPQQPQAQPAATDGDDAADDAVATDAAKPKAPVAGSKPSMLNPTTKPGDKPKRPGAPAGVAAGFTGFAPGFDPAAHRRRRSGGAGPGGGGRPGGPASPDDVPSSVDGKNDGTRRRKPVAVSPTRRAGRPATRRTGAQGRMGRGRRLERNMQEREIWYKASRKQRHKPRKSINVVRPDEVEVQLPISVKDLSALLAIRVTEMTLFLMKQGLTINQNQPVPQDAIELIGAHYNIDIQIVDEFDVEAGLMERVEYEVEEDDPDAEPRQPIVAVLGHVDHGKTTLLDKIRQTKRPVAGSEAGGITQHVGAYVAEHDGKKITFVDTPGHEAFTEMRRRGANVTDIVLLVIAADDGVMPQTKEAIQHAQAADAHIIVALNKIDKANANPEKVLTELSGIDGMQPRDYGGDVDVIRVSALNGDGIDDLLENILFEAEAMELKANPKQAAWGTVLESEKSTGRGVVATVIVQGGTLRRGDSILASRASGRVRSMINDQGKQLKEAGPGTPVEVLGLDEPPEAGEHFFALEKGENLKDILAKREEEERAKIDAGAVPTDEAGVWQALAEQDIKQVFVVVKADTQGTLQVLKREIENLATDEVRCKVIRDGVGGISSADINLALAERTGNVVVVGFGVAADGKAKRLARENNVEIRNHKIIYELLSDLKDVMAGALDPEEREKSLGTVDVRKVFKSSKLGNIAGCFVEQGIVKRNARVRLVRDGIVLWEGELSSLRRFKDDVQEVRENFECGVKLKGYNDIREGDQLDVFEIEKIARTLD
ncbi:MAG: translation initiation factor IF-2 [Planctomycetota bacterium]